MLTQFTKQLVRNVLCMSILICAVVLFALTAYLLLAYPTFTEADSLGGVPPGYGWLGASGERWLYLAIALLFVAPFVGAAFVARRAARASPGPVGIGIVCGIGGAVIAAVIGIHAFLLALTDLRGVSTLDGVTTSVWTPVVAGILGGVATRRLKGAAQAFFLSAVTFAVMTTTVGLATDLMVADHLAQTAWVGDMTCNTFTGHALAGCELGDAVVAALFIWLLMVPVLGAGPLALLTLISARNTFRTRLTESS
jgi:hypothetical protein